MSFTRKFFLILGLFCLVIPFFIGGTDKLLFSQRIFVDSLSKTQPFLSKKWPIQKNQMYQIKLSTSFPNWDDNGNSVAIGANLVNQSKQLLNAKDTEFWYESGYDSDGYWSEEKNRDSWFFKNRGKQETVHLGIYLLDKKIKPRKKKFSPTIRLSIYEGAYGLTSGLFVIIGLIALTIFVIKSWDIWFG